jgi:hypothetical protein
MKDKNYITATQSALMLKDHIDKKYGGNVAKFARETGNDRVNTNAMINGAREITESVMSVFSKRSTRGGKRVVLRPKKHKSYYFTWEPVNED